MILEKGDMFSVWGRTDMFLFTSNPIVNSQGLAVMGRGIAKELADRVPRIRSDFAQRLNDLNQFYNPCCDLIGQYDGQPVGFFMVKYHWREKADLHLIGRSVDELNNWIEDEADFTGSTMRRIDLNFPGIGNGKLDREHVLPIIQNLPDIVHVWEKDNP